MQTQPVEDIEAVLGRFQAWAGLQHAAEVKPGIRELSYEEALASNRYRWKAGAGTTAKKKPEVKDERRSEQRVEAMMAPDTEAQPAQQKAATARSKDARRDASKKARGRHRTRSGREAKQESEQVPVKNAVTTVKAEPKATLFKDVLAEAVWPIEVIVPAQPLERMRQVVVSIRLAPAERALIKTRATEAGLTVSAYIRQCALEVEQLRAQVHQTLAAMERRAAQVPSSAENPGFWRRFMGRFRPKTSRRLVLQA